MLPIFRVKSNTVYTFDDFFNDLIKKFPIVKDYGFCKVLISGIIQIIRIKYSSIPVYIVSASNYLA